MTYLAANEKSPEMIFGALFVSLFSIADKMKLMGQAIVGVWRGDLWVGGLTENLHR
jgi:hypothetical protein